MIRSMNRFSAYLWPVVFLLLIGCSIDQPSASLSGSSINHSQFQTSCINCHSEKLPSSTLAVPTDGTGALYLHAIAFNGTADCVNCHLSKKENLGVSWAGATYDHKDSSGSLLTKVSNPVCVSCHSLERPFDTSGFVGLNINTPFDYSSHGGSLDCSTCHLATSSFLSFAGWQGGVYTHNASLSSCTSCHSSERPSSVVKGFDHSVSGTGDCGSCHQNSLDSTFSSMNDWQGGVGVPGSGVADAAKNLAMTAYIPTYSGTSISSFTSRSESLPQPMLHSSTQITPALQVECADCHSGAASNNYYPGVFHSSLPAQGSVQPTACIDCHTTTMPIGFVGPNNPARSPASPAMKHDAVTWALNGSGVWVPTLTKIVSTECSICHNQPTVAWSGASFHSALSSKSLAQPSSCVDCHANSRPSGSVPASPGVGVTPFDHNSGGLGDCGTCHLSVSAWSGGKFHASASVQSSCNSCHNSQRPSDTSGFAGLNPSAPFDYATHGGTLDCVNCHTSVSTFNLMTDWRNGNYAHSSSTLTCIGCHSTQRPGTPVGSPPFDHSVNGLGDCSGCHQTSITANLFTSLTHWAGGTSSPTGLVGSHTHNVNAVQLNYTNSRVSSTTNQTDTVLERLLHSSVQVTGTGLACSACHPSAGSGVYTGGVFHASLTANGKSQPNLCNDCHGAIAPSYIVGPGIPGSSVSPMDHLAKFTTGTSVISNYDCAACHHTPGVSWTGGAFHGNIGSKTPGDCTVCHYINMPLTLVSKMSHTSSSVTQDCSSCHAEPTAPQIASPSLTYWSGGRFHSRISSQPSTCTDCHTADRPASVKVSANDGQRMNHNSANVAVDCASCHAGDLNLNPRIWSTAAFFHTNATATTCTDCHGLGNGSSTPGTGNDMPAGLTNSTTLTTSSVASAGTYDRITHTDVNVGTRDCNICHTQAGMVGAKWKAASFHINTPSLTMNSTTGRCDHCHMNLKPTVVVGGMDHNTIGSGDCAGCHSYPGTGSMGAGNWLGASGFNHVPTPGSCYSCHSGALPSGTVPNTRDGFKHSGGVVPSPAECVSCHAVVTANIGVRWSGGYFNHLGNSVSALGTALGTPNAPCSPCHDTKKHNAGKNCASSGCHGNRITWPHSSSTGNFGGQWGSP